MARQRPQRAPVGDADEQQLALPKVSCDPLASLPPTEIVTTCAGREWIIPALTADHWLRALWSTPFDPDSIFPGFVEDDTVDDVLLDAFLDDRISLDESSEIAMEVLEVASGYSWWFTIRLSLVFAASWSRLGGMLINSGIDASKMSLGAWCSAALDLCVSNIEPKQATDLINELLKAPEGVGPEVDPFDELEDTEAFMAAMSTVF